MKKFFYIIFLMLLILFESVKSYEYWIREDWELLPVIYVDGYKLPSSYCDFFFLDSLTAMMSHSNGVQGADIIKTTDGGYSWSSILKESIIWKEGKHEYVPALPTSFNVNNGIAVLATTNQTTALKTFSKDSGMVWISLDTGKTWAKNFTGLKSGINEVKILDNGTIVILSDNFIAKSEDIGKTWNKSIEFPNSIYDSTTFTDAIDKTEYTQIWNPNLIICREPNKIFVFAIRNYKGIKNKMLYSSNGGLNWINRELPEKNLVHSFITSDNKLWITGNYKKNDTGVTYIYVDYSTDNGNTWINSLDTVHIDRWSEWPVSTIKFYDSLNGAIVGEFGIFFRTADGGKSWHDEVRQGIKPDTMIYGSFSNFEYVTKHKIALYDYGHLFNARLIMAPLLELPTDVEEFINLGNDFLIYPNPSSDFINISINKEAGLLSREVQILNLLGLVVSKQELRDGNNRIDISDLPRGTYFIKIGDKVEKFVKM